MMMRTLLFLIALVVSETAIARVPCYVPNHPDICPQIIGLLDQMRQQGKLSIQEWDGVSLQVDPANPFFTKNAVEAGHQYGVNFMERQSSHGGIFLSFSLMDFIRGGGVMPSSGQNQLQNLEQNLAFEMQDLAPYFSSVIIEGFTPNANQYAAWQRYEKGIRLTSTYQPAPGAYLVIAPLPSKIDAISGQHKQLNLAPLPSKTTATSGQQKQITATTQTHPMAIHVTKIIGGKKVDAKNINQFFITRHAGDHLEQNQRAYMEDSQGKIWSCNIAGMLARTSINEAGELEVNGHFETLHYKNRQLAHVPGLHGQHQGCLISVQK